MTPAARCLTGVRPFLLILLFIACRPSGQARYVSKDCAPRNVDAAPICGVAPTASDRVTRFSLNGPDTGGDQMHGNVCMGLLLETEYASGAICRQRIASFASIGILGADGVYVDDRLVCFRVERDALVVRRDEAIVATVAKPPGIEDAPSFPARCVD
jgi:hypothetical protein